MGQPTQTERSTQDQNSTPEYQRHQYGRQWVAQTGGTAILHEYSTGQHLHTHRVLAMLRGT